MTEKFSFLDKDKKTYVHAKLYYDALSSEKELSLIDIDIQKMELSAHLSKFCKEHDKKEETDWVCQNAKPFRIYINSLKEIALFAYISSKIYYHDDFSYELFCRIVDVYDLRKKAIDSIKVDE